MQFDQPATKKKFHFTHHLHSSAAVATQDKDSAADCGLSLPWHWMPEKQVLPPLQVLKTHTLIKTADKTHSLFNRHYFYAT